MMQGARAGQGRAGDRYRFKGTAMPTYAFLQTHMLQKKKAGQHTARTGKTHIGVSETMHNSNSLRSHQNAWMPATAWLNMPATAQLNKHTTQTQVLSNVPPVACRHVICHTLVVAHLPDSSICLASPNASDPVSLPFDCSRATPERPCPPRLSDVCRVL